MNSSSSDRIGKTPSERQDRQPRRIILATESRLLQEMLFRVLDREPGLEVVATVSDPGQLLSLARKLAAHWIVVSYPSDGREVQEVRAALASDESIHVLGLASDGSRVLIHWSEPQEQELQQASLGEFITILQSVSP